MVLDDVTGVTAGMQVYFLLTKFDCLGVEYSTYKVRLVVSDWFLEDI